MDDKGYMSCAFYVQAHQDDWQFFFAKQAWIDLNSPTSKVVFVYTTAGDGNPGDDSYHKEGWWESRECGALASTLRATLTPEELEPLVDKLPLPNEPFAWEEVIRNGRRIVRRVWRNTVSYLVRIPSMSPLESGGEGPSLEGLHKGTLKKGLVLKSIDGLASYETWADFGKTLWAIIDEETPAHLKGKDSTTDYRPCIIVSDDDKVRNPGDNSDHHETSLAVKEYVAPHGGYSVALYSTYYTNTTHRPQLSGEWLERKQDVYDAYRDTFVKKLAMYGGDSANVTKYCNREWGDYGSFDAYWRWAPSDWAEKDRSSA
ncbi:hypothetical protein ACMHYB_06635 [Sorangium sp. So ce1128]